MLSLPFELIENILCCLPVKPLKRFRCVAKPWCFLIDSERFIKSHLKRSLETNSHRHLIVGGKDVVFTVDFDNDDPVVKANKASVVKLPFSNSVNDISISCNGLFLAWGCKPLIIILWNPFTMKCKNLPLVGDELECSQSKISYGFAYDSRNDEYKVVRVVEHRDINTLFASRAHIYGLKSNSWKQTENFTYPVPHLIKTDVNGALHTLLIQHAPVEEVGPGTAKILAFSVESERQYEVELPLGNIWTRDVVLSLHKIGGCLSVNDTSESGISIWVMKDYGVRESWTKLLFIPIRLTVDELYDTMPLVYSKDGHKVLMYLGYDTFFWQDLRNGSLENVAVKGLPLMLDYVETCVESLVSFRSEEQAQNLHDQDKKVKKKIRKKRDDLLSKGFKLVLCL